VSVIDMLPACRGALKHWVKLAYRLIGDTPSLLWNICRKIAYFYSLQKSTAGTPRAEPSLPSSSLERARDTICKDIGPDN
jgi:hypothetical protein